MADAHINLQFTADTSKAKAQLQDLQQTLTNLTMNKGGNPDAFSLSSSIQKATQSAAQLKATLTAATNVKTGQLDLTKFSQSLEASGMSLKKYKIELEKLGPTGSQAFAQLSSSIMNASAPINTVNSKLKEFAVTLKNTAKWQISSTLLHGLMSAVQSAYGYAKDLNESLNNIRIVTGYNVDQMSKFADEANRAAKALSTTTTAYTDASLIYYQQGLGDKEVKERTDVTMKLANVSRQSAEEVSSQMTAIWNNFDNGTKSLEYYGDAITALGAKTASSSAEIAEGLQKFAAVSDTVGLSYEYATAALATVVAQTRQSADTVGTAFKTLFARIEGLKLGETLEDGTTFNQYSEALAKIGVNIKDTNGELRNMDNILDDLGAKWKELSRDEQVAVAQKVAGVRQYQQMIALMDNYDIFKENVNVAANSAGTLQKQQEIYAESWEAASKRVKAAMQSVYRTLLNDEFFIKLTDSIGKAIEWVEKFIKSIGGVKSILAALGLVAVKVFSKDIAQNIQTLSLGLTAKSRQAKQQEIAANTKAEAANLTSKLSFDEGTSAGVAKGNMYKAQAEMQTALIQNANNLTEIEQNTLRILMDQVSALHEAAIASAERLDSARDNVDANEKDLRVMGQVANQLGKKAKFKPLSEDSLNSIKEANHGMGKMLAYTDKLEKSTDSWGQGVSVSKQKYLELLDNIKDSNKEIKAFGDNDLTKSIDEKANAIKNKIANLTKGKEFGTGSRSNAVTEGLKNEFKELGDLVEQADEQVRVKTERMAQNVKNTTQEGQKYQNGVRAMADANRDLGDSEVQQGADSKIAAEGTEEYLDQVEKGGKKLLSFEDRISAVGTAFMSLAMVANSLSSIIETITDPDLSGLDKAKSILLSLAMMIPMLISGVRSIGTAITAEGAKAQVAWGWIGAVLSIVSALAIFTINIVQQISNAQTGTEKKIAKLKKEVEDLEEASEKVKGEIEDIQDALDNYDEAIKTLNECTKGTNEWYDALKNVNNIILELLDKYPDLANIEGLFSRDKDTGLRSINQDVAKQAIADKQNSATAIDLLKTQKDNEMKQLEYTQSKEYFVNTLPTNFIHNVDPSLNDSEDIRGVILNHFEELANLTETEFTSKLKEIFTDAGYSESKDFFNNLSKFRTQITEVANQAEGVADSIQIANELIVQSNLKFKKEEYTNGTAGAITAVVAKQLPELIEKEQETYENKLRQLDRGDTNASRADAKNIIDEFNKIKGTTYTLANNAIRGSAENREIWVKEQGQSDKEAKGFTADYIASVIAAEKALEGLGVAANKARDILNNIKTGDDDFDNDLVKYITSGNMGDTSKFNLNKMKIMSDEKIQGLFGGPEDFAEYAQQLFPDAEDAVKEALAHVRASIDEGLQGIDDAFQLTSTVVQEQWKNMNDQLKVGMSENETKQLAGYMQQAFENNGRQASQYVADLFNKLGENADEVLEMINSSDIDLTTASVGALDKMIQDAGLTGAITTDELKSLANAIKSVGDNASQSLSSLQNTYAEKEKITSGLSYGDTISKDDWATLDLDPEIANKYFIEMADGTHKLIGDAEEFQEKVNAINLKPFKEKLDSINSELQKYYGFENEQTYDDLSHNAGSVVTNGKYINSQNFASSQLSYLQGAGYEAEGFDIAQLQDILANETDPQILQQTYDEIADAISECGDQSELFKQKQQENEAEAEQLKQILDEQKAQNIIDASGLDEESVRNVANAFQEMYKALSLNEEEATRAAVKYMNLQNAVLDLNDNLTDYKKVLKDLKDSSNALNKSLVKNSENYKKLRTSVANLIGTSEDLADAFFDSDLFDPKALEKAAKGDIKAIEDIQKSFASFNLNKPMEQIEEFCKSINDIPEGHEITLEVLNETALGKLLQTKIAAATSADELRDMLTGLPIDFDLIEMEGTLAEAQKAADEAGGILADNLSMEAEINPASNKETDKQEQVTFTETYRPEGVVTATSQVLQEGASELVPVTASYIKMGKNVEFNKVTENSTKETSADSVNVKTGGGKEGKVGKHTIVKPKKSVNTNSVAPSTTNAIKSCFVAGTLISLSNSFKNIEDIKIGDIVLSYNEKTKQNEYSKVLQTMIHYVNENIYNLYIENEILSVTGNHKFLVKQNNFVQWIPAEQIQIGDYVFFADYTWHKISNIQIKLKLITVYNFEVANNHNYYVGLNKILAHNKGGGSGGGGGGKSTPAEKKDHTKKEEIVDRYKKIEDKIKTVNKSLEKYNKLSDQAYGKGKIRAMDKVLAAKRQEIKLQQKLIDEAKQYVTLDKQNLITTLSENGASAAKFDNDGNIINVETILEKMYNHLYQLEEKYNSFATKEQQDEYDKSTLSPYREQISRVRDAISLYDSSRDKLSEAETKKMDLQLEYLSTHLEKLNHLINSKIDFRQTEIAKFEKELEKLENRAFSTAQRFSLLNAQTKAYNNVLALSQKGIRNVLKDQIYKEDKKGNIITYNQKMKDAGYNTQKRNDIFDNLLAGQATKTYHGSVSEFFDTWTISEDGINALLEYQNSLDEASTALDEIKDTIDHEVLLVFNRWVTAMENNTKRMDHWTTMFDKYNDVIEKVGAYRMFDQNSDGTFNSRDQINAKMAKYRENRYDIALSNARADYSNYETAWYDFNEMSDIYQKREKENNSLIRKEYKQLLNTYISDKTYKDPKTWAAGTNVSDFEKNELKLLETREKYAKHLIELQEKENDLTGEALEENLRKQKKVNKWLDDFDTHYEKIKQYQSEINEMATDTEEARDKVQELREKTAEDLLNLIDMAQEMAMATVEDSISSFETTISGAYKTLENMQNALSLNKRLSEEYVGDYERVYELTKLNRDLEKKMDETSNIKAKEKLAKLQEKIKQYAAEGVKMSQYELDIMQKEYDLEVAKIAMEEAQNAKSQVRLTRDAEGNYSYTYTADETKVAEAEQNYEDKLNDLIKFNNEYQEKMLESQLNITAQMEDAIRDLAEKRVKGLITEEEWVKQSADLEAWYTEQYNYFAMERDKASQHQTQTYMNDYETHYGVTDKMIHVTRSFSDETVKSYNEIFDTYTEAQIKRDQELYALNQAYADGLISIEEYLTEFRRINNDYATETEGATETFKTIMDTALVENEKVVGSVKDGFNGIIMDGNSTFLPQMSNIWTSASEDAIAYRKALIGDSETGEIDSTSTIGSMINAVDQYAKNIALAMEAVGITLDPESKDNPFPAFAQEVEDQMTRAKKHVEALETSIINTNATAQREMNEAVQKTLWWYKNSYQSWVDAKTNIDNLSTSITGLIAAASGITPITPEAETTAAKDSVDDLNTRIKKLSKSADEASVERKPEINTNNASGNAKGLKTDYDNLNTSGKEAGKKVTTSNDTKSSSSNAKKLKSAYDDLNKSSSTAAKTVTMKAKTEDTKKKIDALKKSYDNLTTAAKNAQKQVNSGLDQEPSNTGGSTQGDGKLQVGDKVTLLSQGYEDSWGNGKKIKQEYVGTTVKIDKKSSTKVSGGQWSGDVGDYYIHVSTLNGGDLGWVKKSQISGFDTGGYTGKWGRDGRFALLHQKELVLNEQDTQNMLAAVKTVREIAAMVDLQAQNANLAGQYALALNNIPTGGKGQMEQNVHITAEFPNVQDHNEVELALTSLVNRASQFAYRN